MQPLWHFKHTRTTIRAFCYRHNRRKNKLAKNVLPEKQPPPTVCVHQTNNTTSILHTYTPHICTHPFKKTYQSAATCTPQSPVAAKAFSLYKDQGMTAHYEQKNREVFKCCVVYMQQQIICGTKGIYGYM